MFENIRVLLIRLYQNYFVGYNFRLPKACAFLPISYRHYTDLFSWSDRMTGWYHASLCHPVIRSSGHRCTK